MAKMKLSVGAITDVGMRRVNNEDNFYVPGVKIKGKDVKVYDIRQEHAKGLQMEDGNAFFAVCDGMGGHNAGEYASLMAVKAIKNAYAKIIMVNEYQQGKEVIDAFLSEVNAQISSAAAQDPGMAGMGCTLCGLYFFGSNRVMPVNVGDSRIYMVKGTKLIQLSVDHIDSSSGKGALTRYLGMPEEYGDVTGEYGVRHEVLSKKTRFLLCSDGLTDMVSPEDILYHLRKSKTAEESQSCRIGLNSARSMVAGG